MIPAARNQFDGLKVGVGGIAVTWAGLTVGGMAQGGRFNGQWNLAPKGSSDAFAWLAGASYTYGPLVVGASYFDYESPGVRPARLRPPLPASLRWSASAGSAAVAAGGTYSVAPGLALFVSYLWGDRKENGYDFITGQTSTATFAARGRAAQLRAFATADPRHQLHLVDPALRSGSQGRRGNPPPFSLQARRPLGLLARFAGLLWL